MPKKIIAYNVNGLRSVLKKEFVSYVLKESPDVLFLGETKTQDKTKILPLMKQYPFQYFNSAEKKGYSSTALFTKEKPLETSYAFPNAPDGKGRLIFARFKSFLFVGVYVLNSGRGLVRLKERTKMFDTAFYQFLKKLLQKQPDLPLVVAGDLNVARFDTDVHNPDAVRNKSAGFTDAERVGFEKLLEELNLEDVYFRLHPGIKEDEVERKKCYTWYSAMQKWERGGPKGWRLDYFLLTNKHADKALSMTADQTVGMSDHVPVVLELDVN